jgi:hypothetical protein
MLISFTEPQVNLSIYMATYTYSAEEVLWIVLCGMRFKHVSLR